jgi:hypothetical protein
MFKKFVCHTGETSGRQMMLLQSLDSLKSGIKEVMLFL